GRESGPILAWVGLRRGSPAPCIPSHATCSVALSNSYPQGEIVFAAPIMRSTSKAVSSFPCSQARQLSGSVLGRWPRSMIDFMRLKASSICHRDRYNSRTCFRLQVDGSVVQAKKYRAASNDASVTVVCFLLACCRSFFLAYS